MNWGQSTLPIKILKIAGWITFTVKACFPLGFKTREGKKKNKKKTERVWERKREREKTELWALMLDFRKKQLFL